MGKLKEIMSWFNPGYLADYREDIELDVRRISSQEMFIQGKMFQVEML